MSLNASKVVSASRKPRAPALEPGAYPARIVQVVALGLQPQGEYQGQEKPPAHSIMVTYELVDEFMVDEDGNEDETKPRWVSEEFALHSLDSDLATSTKRYFALDPEKNHGGDWTKLLGVPCMVTMIKKTAKTSGNEYNRITGVAAMRSKEAAKTPELVNDAMWFDIDAPDMEVFWKLPQFIRNKMTEDNLEFGGSVLEKAIEKNPQPEKTDESKKSTTKKSQKVTKEEDEDDEVEW